MSALRGHASQMLGPVASVLRRCFFSSPITVLAQLPHLKNPGDNNRPSQPPNSRLSNPKAERDALRDKKSRKSKCAY